MNDGDESDRHTAGIFIRAGIQVILEDNQFGLRPRDTILNGRVPRLLQTTHLHDGVWNALEATMKAREKIGQQQYSVLFQSLKF